MTHRSTLQASLPPSLAKSRSAGGLQTIPDRLSATLDTNSKLKQLLSTMRNNQLARKIEGNRQSQARNDEQQLVKLQKKEARLRADIQQLTNNLNALTSDNNKLKMQVDSSRNSRVIYSNVYKTLEKQIRKHEYLYRLAIIENLSYQEVSKRLHEKVNKLSRKLNRDINELEGNVQPMRKRTKKKSRIDTGFSSATRFTQPVKLETKHTLGQRIQSRVDLGSPEPLCLAKEVQGSKATTDRNNKERSVPLSIRGGQKSIRQERKTIHRDQGELSEQNYEYQRRINYYENILSHLREICPEEDLEGISMLWENGQGMIEKAYSEYQENQKHLRQLEDQGKEADNLMVSETGVQLREEAQLLEVEGQLEREAKEVQELEKQLTQLMDINVSRLSDEQVKHHVLRMQRGGDVTHRELERLLQSNNQDGLQTLGMGMSRLKY